MEALQRGQVDESSSCKGSAKSASSLCSKKYSISIVWSLNCENVAENSQISDSDVSNFLHFGTGDASYFLIPSRQSLGKRIR